MNELTEMKYLLISFDFGKLCFRNDIVLFKQCSKPFVPDSENFSEEIQRKLKAKQTVLNAIPYFDSFNEKAVKLKSWFNVTASCKKGFEHINMCNAIRIPFPLKLNEKHGIRLALSFKTVSQIRESFLKLSGESCITSDDFMITGIMPISSYKGSSLPLHLHQKESIHD